MRYKAVTSDMDETFLGRDHRIPQANLAALARMQELGVPFVPSSGRPYSSVLMSIPDEARPFFEGSYIISLNGACINRFGEGTPLTSHAMDYETIEQIFKLSSAYEVAVHVYEMDGTVWGTRMDKHDIREMHSLLTLKLFEGNDISFLRERPLAKILFDKRDLAYLHRIAEDLFSRADIARKLTVTYSSSRFLEFCPPGIDKGVGVADLCKILGISPAEVIAMGDAENDLSMFAAAGMAVAVANATQGVPEHADYVCKADCDEGALAEVVERFLEPQE